MKQPILIEVEEIKIFVVKWRILFTFAKVAEEFEKDEKSSGS